MNTDVPKFGRLFDPNPKTITEIIESEINDSVSYNSGQIESLEAKVNKQTKIIVALAGLLPRKRQLLLARELLGHTAQLYGEDSDEKDK